MGNTIIQINPYDKRLNVKIEGSLLAGDDQEFYSEYKKEITLIPTSEFTVEVDCTDLYVDDLSQMLLLENIYHALKSEDFKQVLFIFKQSSHLNNRLFVDFINKHQLPEDQLKAV
ncbi:hypothetical protein [Salipaludibacillus daqingensis]|uniref:hypothetical protein n=1 Tax=Salipaludibacillus daqingensis TaxID=3041001 RepID=UPI0024760759|nr:hypothetical protein [Salipaludibacillus daqingensis]